MAARVALIAIQKCCQSKIEDQVHAHKESLYHCLYNTCVVYTKLFIDLHAPTTLFLYV